MLFHLFIWRAENPARADKSALGAINRPLLYGLPTSSPGQCHYIVPLVKMV